MDFKTIEDTVRRNCKGGCYWTLHIVDNTTLSKTDLACPNAKNMADGEGNIDDSIEKLKEDISALAPIGKKYIVVALRSKPSGEHPIVLPFPNPNHIPRESGGGMGINGIGGMGLFGLLMNQMNKNQELQLEIIKKDNDRKIGWLRRKMREQQEAEKISGLGDKIMSLLEHPTLAPVIQGVIGKLFGVNSIGSADGEPETDGGQLTAEQLESNIEDIAEVVGKNQLSDFLQTFTNYIKNNPQQAKAFYKNIKSQE